MSPAQRLDGAHSRVEPSADYMTFDRQPLFLATKFYFEIRRPGDQREFRWPPV